MAVQLLGEPDDLDQDLHRTKEVVTYNGIDFLSTKLSEELVVRITSDLKYPRDIRALSLANRKLHRVALPLLFAHIDFRPHTRRDKDGCPYYSCNAEFTKLKFRPFVVLMLQRPDLAGLIRSFCMTPGFDSDYSRMFLHDVPNEKSWEEFGPVLEKAVDTNAHSQGEKATWIEALKAGGDDDPLLALLLPCLSNMQRLALQMPENAPFCERMMDRCALREKTFDKNREAFGRLQSFGGSYFEDESAMKPYWFARCLRLPNIRRIFMNFIATGSGNMEYGAEDEHLALVPARSSSCDYIELRNSKLSGHDIRKTIEACRQLKTFIYEIGWGYLSWCNYPDTRQLMNVLAHYEDCLENLSLELAADHDADSSILLAPISLSIFKRLKNVRLSPLFLEGRRSSEDYHGHPLGYEHVPHRSDLEDTLPDLFPRSIERLCISNAQCSFDVVAAGLKKLLLNKQQAHPTLKRLVLQGSWIDKPESWPDLAALRAVASQVGVSFAALDAQNSSTYEPEVRSVRGMGDEFWWAELGSESRRLQVFDESRAKEEASQQEGDLDG